MSVNHERRLREAQKQAEIALEELDRDTQEWALAHSTIHYAESARVFLEGPEILIGDPDDRSERARGNNGGERYGIYQTNE